MKTTHLILLCFMAFTATLRSIDTYGQQDTALMNTKIAAANVVADNDSAITMYKRLLEQSKATANADATIRILNLIGQRYFNKGDNNTMISYQQQAIAYARQSANQYHHLATLYNNLGICFQSSGNYDSSLVWYYAAITAQEKYTSTISMAIPYINLGLLCQRLKRYGTAANNLKHALHIAEEENNTRLIASTYLNLGGLYAAMNKADSFPEAEHYLSMAVSVAQKRGYRDIEHKAFCALAVLSENRGLMDEAIGYYKKALLLPMGVAYDDLIPLINLGHAYLAQGRYKEAEIVLSPGLRQALALKPPPDYLCDFYLYLGAVSQAEGKYKKAAELLSEYIKLSDELRGDRINERVDNLTAQYESSRRDNELLKKELLIARQKATIQRNSLVTYIILFSVVCMALLLLLYLRNKKMKLKKKQEKALWNATLQGEETERGRIARELHDNIGGSLSNARMWFATIQKSSEVNYVDPEFAGALDLLDHAITEVRSSAHALMPELLLRYGLAEAVKIHSQNIERASGIKVVFRYLGYIDKAEKGLELILYRSIQEILQNAVKHSGSHVVMVQLSCHEQVLMVTIEDQGRGMVTGDRPNYRGMGLEHVKRSIEQLGGSFIVQSVPGCGTSINFEVDLNTID